METGICVEITPEIAKKLLDSSKGNRGIKAAFLAKYKRDMLEGRWHYNGESIKLLPDGTLYDGHHRCTASVQTGKSFTAAVVYINNEAKATVDKGASRSAADNFVFDLGLQASDASTLSSAVRVVISHDAGKNTDWARVPDKDISHQVMEDYLIRHIEEFTAALDWVSERVRKQNTLISKGQAVAIHVLSCRIYGKESVEDYLSKVLTGYGVVPGTTEDHIRSALVAVKMNQRKMTLSQKTYSVVKGLKSVMAGRSIKWATNACFRPNIDPVPVLK